MFDLQAFNEKREAAQAKSQRWDCSAEELKAAYAAGVRDFRYANLRGEDLWRANLSGANLWMADLSGANLSGANLSGANLLNAPGVYAAFGAGMSSRTDTLYGGVVLQDGSIALRFWAGCKECVTADWLRARVKKEHAGKSHETQYMAAIAFIETCFESDMAAKRWDYLLDWKPVKKETEAGE